jgi:dedicator of cytokinesis protein 3
MQMLAIQRWSLTQGITVFTITVNCFNVSSFSIFQVETELIDKLDILVSENKGDEEYKHLFNAM